MSNYDFIKVNTLIFYYFFIIFWVISLDYLLIIAYFVFTYVPKYHFFLNREPSWEIVCITFPQTSFINQNYDNLFGVSCNFRVSAFFVWLWSTPECCPELVHNSLFVYHKSVAYFVVTYLTLLHSFTRSAAWKRARCHANGFPKYPVYGIGTYIFKIHSLFYTIW